MINAIFLLPHPWEGSLKRHHQSMPMGISYILSLPSDHELIASSEIMGMHLGCLYPRKKILQAHTHNCWKRFVLIQNL